MARDKLLDRVYESLVTIIAPVATSNPKSLKPGETVKLLNSTPLGTVLDDRKLRKHRERAGMRIGDGRTIDLLRYAAWLIAQPRAVQPTPAAVASTKAEKYEIKKERERQRNAEKAREGNDIGAEVEAARTQINWDRRKKGSARLRDFFLTYCTGDLENPPSDMHFFVLDTLELCILSGGWFALAMPRGSGKTTMVMAAALWAVLNGHTPFIVIVAAAKDKAEELLERIKREFETNDLLCEDWPEICLPIRALEGIVNRCKGQRYFGERTFIGYKGKEIALPTVPNSVASGAVIRVGGLLGSAVRGPLYKHPDGRSLRPSLCLVDDPQTDASAKSRPQTRKRMNCLTKGATGMCGPGKRMSILVTCTVIEGGDMADQLLDQELNPHFQGQKWQMLKSFPTKIELWKEYYAIVLRNLRIGKGDVKEQNAFYKKHRKAMDEGAEVTWEDRYIKDTELSAIQHAMNIWLRDPEFFASEMQNTPLENESSEAQEWYLKAADLALRVNKVARGRIPLWTSQHLVGHVDVQQRMLFWTAGSVGDGFTMSFPDYGTYPQQPRAHFTYRDAPVPIKRKKGQGIDAALLEALEALIDELFSREWPTENGQTSLKLESLLIDTGYKPELVHKACRRSQYRAMLYPCKGMGQDLRRPLNEWKDVAGEIAGDNWRLVPAAKHGSRLLLYDTNYWKTFLHQRLSTAFGDPANGSCTLFGNKGTDHNLFAEHLTSEEVEWNEKKSCFEFKLPSNKPDNHWLDNGVGCCVAASMKGCKLGVRLNPKRGKRPAPRVRHSQPLNW